VLGEFFWKPTISSNLPFRLVLEEINNLIYLERTQAFHLKVQPASKQANPVHVYSALLLLLFEASSISLMPSALHVIWPIFSRYWQKSSIEWLGPNFEPGPRTPKCGPSTPPTNRRIYEVQTSESFSVVLNGFMLIKATMVRMEYSLCQFGVVWCCTLYHDGNCIPSIKYSIPINELKWVWASWHQK
jgi:hypothetical protein